jgi:DNA-binding NtrC family response regulator
MYNFNIDNPFASQTNLLWHLDRLREWKSEGDSFPIQMEIDPTSYCSEAYRWCITNYSHVFSPPMSKEDRQSQFRKLDAKSIIANHPEHRRGFRRNASDIGSKSKPSKRLNVKGEKDGVKLSIKGIQKENQSYWISGEAQRGDDKFNIEYWIDDEDYLGTEFAGILHYVKALLTMLFDDYSEAGRGKIIPNTDDTSQEEDDLRFNEIKHVEFTDESWQNYESRNKLWREVLKDSGLVCGDKSSSLDHIVSQLIKKAERDNIKYLIIGEPGTGKELVAKAIHNLSSRREEPFVAVNAGAIPSHLVASEFFGYKRGAFTGAISDKIGLFEQANNGTIFLDEIGNMNYEDQKYLLRVLQEGTVRPLGGIEEIEVDVRVVAATNKNLEKMVKEGNFHRDLYDRLNGLKIRLPSLRERREDIPALVQYFSIMYRNENKKGKDHYNVDYNEEIFKAMIWYDWRGNIRQLENFIEITLPSSEEKRISFSDIHTDLSDELEITYGKYEENSKPAKLILKLTDIAAKMLTETWEVLENAWEIWQERRTVSFSNLKLEKEIFYQELDNRDSQRIGEIIQDAWKEFGELLECRGCSGIKNSNCYNMLISCYESHGIRQAEKTTKRILQQVFEKLQEMNLDLSHKLEKQNYNRFKEFFGKTHRSLRDWKEK